MLNINACLLFSIVHRAFFVIVKSLRTFVQPSFEALVSTLVCWEHAPVSGVPAPGWLMPRQVSWPSVTLSLQPSSTHCHHNNLPHLHQPSPDIAPYHNLYNITPCITLLQHIYKLQLTHITHYLQHSSFHAKLYAFRGRSHITSALFGVSHRGASATWWSSGRICLIIQMYKMSIYMI